MQEETGISCVEEGHVVEGLYRETTCIRYPTLAILNLTDVNAPWVQADIQSRYVHANMLYNLEPLIFLYAVSAASDFVLVF